MNGSAVEIAQAYFDGWDHCFARLAVVGAGRDPGSDPWIEEPMP